MVRFIYGNRRIEYVETDLTSIPLIRDETYPIQHREVKCEGQDETFSQFYIPLQPESFIHLVNKIPDFKFDMLQPVVKVACNEAYIEMNYVRDGRFKTLEWGNITSKPEYEYVAAFVRKCLDQAGYKTVHFCETFESYVKYLITENLKFENNMFWHATAALLADRMLGQVLKKYDGKDVSFEDIRSDDVCDIANEVMIEYLKKQ